MSSHAIFVFPYVIDHEVFVPTSILEAMHIGIPVVATDRRMYRALTVADGIPRCRLSDDTVEGLRTALQSTIDDLEAARARATLVSRQIEQEWSVRQAADDLMGALAALS